MKGKSTPMLCGIAAVAVAAMATTASGKQQADYSKGGARPVPIQNPGFEERGAGGSVVGWQVKSPYEVRDGAGRDGGAALVYEAETPPPYFVPSQGFSVKPGRSYKASAWFKAESLRGGQGLICLEWYDAKGGYIDGSYLIEGMRGPTEDWRKIVVMATRLPKNAVFLRVGAYVEKGATGCVFFDDVEVVEIPTHAVEGLYSDAYRNRAASGPVTFFADLNLDAADLHPEDVRAEFSLPFAGGRRTVPADALEDDWASVTVDATALESGEVLAVVRLLSRDGGGEQQADDSIAIQFTRLDAEPTTGVWIDRHGRTIINGTPFFPLGMYWGGINREDIDLYARGPFNCLMPYDPNLTREQLDLCAERGLRANCNLKDWYSFRPWAKDGNKTRADADAQAEKFILELRDHPALLAWYHNDEIGLQHIDEMTARYRQIQALDPNHPAWSMLYQFTQTRDFLPSFDITGTDPYPEGHKEWWTFPSKWPERQRRDTFGKRPIWQAVQCYCNAKAQKGFGRENAPPGLTAIEEMRNMAWQALVAGARGIFFYSFFDLKKDAAKYGVPFEDAFAEVCEVASEVKRFEDVLLSTESVAIEADSPWLGVRTWKLGGVVYLAIVNKRHEPTTGRVTVEAPAGAVEALIGEAPGRTPDGAFEVDLPPCGVVFARIEAAKIGR